MLKRQIKQLIYNQMQVSRVKCMQRKEDARKKIQLGGLLVKAGFDHMHPHDAYVLYGMLLDCKRALKAKPELRQRWAAMGQELLIGEKG